MSKILRYRSETGSFDRLLPTTMTLLFTRRLVCTCLRIFPLFPIPFPYLSTLYTLHPRVEFVTLRILGLLLPSVRNERVFEGRL